MAVNIEESPIWKNVMIHPLRANAIGRREVVTIITNPA